MTRGTALTGGSVSLCPASFEASMLIRLLLILFVATLVLACSPQEKPVAVADKAPVSDKAAICRAKCMADLESPTPAAKPVARPARPRVHRVSDQPRVIRGTGRVTYVSEGPRGGVYGGAYGGRYAGAAVSVTETSASTASYRYSEFEERRGSRGGSYASGSVGSGYASGAAAGGYTTGGSGRESRYGPPPATTGSPAHRPGPTSGQLAGITRDGALTWPGKVDY